jgi:hypothetical protein
VKVQRRALGTPALVGAALVVAVMVGAIAYVIGQSEASSVVTSTSITSIAGAGTTSLTTDVATSSGSSTTVTTTSTAVSTSTSTTTTTVTYTSTTYSCPACVGGCQECVGDIEGDGM